MGPEAEDLLLPGHILIVIVQTNLSNGLDLGIFPDQLPVCIQHVFPHLVCSIGVGAYGGVYPGMGLGQSSCSPGRGQIAAGIHEKPDSLLWQPGQKRLPVRVKPVVIQVGMGVK